MLNLSKIQVSESFFFFSPDACINCEAMASKEILGIRVPHIGFSENEVQM